MTRKESDMNAVFDELFAAAEADDRKLTAAELMRAVGLSRTSINGTYRHVNARRLAHNTLVAQRRSRSRTLPPQADESSQVAIAKLRSDLEAERQRSEQYAHLIRELTLQLHAARHDNETVINGRHLFLAGRTSSESAT